MITIKSKLVPYVDKIIIALFKGGNVGGVKNCSHSYD